MLYQEQMLFQENPAPMSMQRRLGLLSYRSFFENVRNRLCRHEERWEYDFLTTQHQSGEIFLQQYLHLPRTIHCTVQAGLFGEQKQITYLVIGSVHGVILLLSPDDAVERDMPFMAIFDGQQFQPYHGNAIQYWQTHIEPTPAQSGNVLYSADMAANFNVIPR